MTDQLQKFMKEALTSYSDGNLDLAEENFKKILSLDQENYQSIYNLGIISFNRKKYTQAEEYLLKAFELNKTEKYLISLIELFIITKDYDNAVKILETNTLLIDKSKKKEIDDKIVKFREHFHGWHDYASPGAGITAQTGIPAETMTGTLVIEPNIDELSNVLEARDDIAAVILEPTGGHWGQYPIQNPYFLSNVRELTKKHTVVMIMDEVICGFRISKGGAQAKFSVIPDLTTMAKIVAGGMPGGAVAGKAEIMDQLSFDLGSNRVDHHGTFNANPATAAAGIATLKIIDRDPINSHADSMSIRLKAGLNEQLSKYEVKGHAHGVSSIVHILLDVECSCDGYMCTLDHSEIARACKTYSGAVKMAMLNEGVDMMGGIGFMVSGVHDENTIDSTTEAFGNALKAMRGDGIIR